MRHIPLIPGEPRQQLRDNDQTGINLDASWFVHHRWRYFHARPSLPGELDGWGPLSHLEKNWMLVRVARNRRGKFTAYERIGVSFRGELPDDERFLERLWQHHQMIKARSDHGLHFLSPDEIKALFAEVIVDGQ